MSVVQPRAAFLMDYMGGNHLHVVLYDLDKDGLCLLAPVSSIKKDEYYDPACVLHNVDHEWLWKLSYVVYSMMHQPRNRHVGKMISLRLYDPKDPVEQEVFDRIVDGLFASEDANRRIVNDARKAGLKPRLGR